jgi:ectoine hydroxylase-related dioxygenase (phytanoyl-CoA dioxygenase family)
MSLNSFDAAVSSALVVEALRRDGAAIVRNLASTTLVDAVTAELRVKLDESGTDHQASYPTGFSGHKTLRCYGVLRFSPSSSELIAHRMVLEVADAILLPACSDYQLGSTTAIEILPGQGEQPLHRDDSPYPIEVAGLELQIGVMWALSEFTAENGATRIVKGSHRILRSWHKPALTHAEQAIMPRGSAVFYLGSTWHGSGENRTTGVRTGLINTYSLGWLRSESNHMLEVPPPIAARYNENVRRLLGYTTHGDGEDQLGHYDGTQAVWVAPRSRAHPRAGPA